jgi:dTDP-4-dehydrorhamnose 3,5-epimerase/CDP-3, 6-dideoxy-D-glycero-D-glycero-4-hexulose-5-epimerase
MLDLRTQSPTYGKVITIKLSSQSSNIVSIPKGVAHGFLSQSDIAVLVYKVTTVHDPKNDCGVLWNSIPFEWPIQNPIISERDANLKPFQDFTSPFI